MLTLQQWKEENKQNYSRGEFNEVTPVSSVRFIQKINKPDVAFVKENDTHYVMFKSIYDIVRGNNRITNIDIDPSNRDVYYEGKGSIKHCVVGDDADYDAIVSILNNKVVDPKTIDRSQIASHKTRWIRDFELANKLAKKYNATSDTEYFAEVEDIFWNGSMSSLAKDAGFPVKSGYYFYSADKQHKVQITGWNGLYNMYVYSSDNVSKPASDDNIYDTLNNIDDDLSL